MTVAFMQLRTLQWNWW